MKNKRIGMTLGTITSFVLPAVAVVSCGGESANIKRTPEAFSAAKMWESFVPTQYFDAEIINWIDGDTLVVKKDGETKTRTIRVYDIDTPEINHDHAGSAHVDSAEERWGLEATNFAKKLIPVHSTIRLVSTGSETYNRLVASIFYGDNFENNFEVKIIEAGLAFPDVDVDTIKKYYYVNYWIGLDLYNAYHSAVNNHRGIFSIGSIKDIEKVITTHGVKDTSMFNPNNDEGILRTWKDTHEIKSK